MELMRLVQQMNCILHNKPKEMLIYAHRVETIAETISFTLWTVSRAQLPFSCTLTLNAFKKKATEEHHKKVRFACDGLANHPGCILSWPYGDRVTTEERQTLFHE